MGVRKGANGVELSASEISPDQSQRVAMKFRVVSLGRDYPGKIEDFAKARNFFLENLPDNEYVLFLDDDEEAPRLLLDYIASLKPQFPYYNIRHVGLVNNRYIPLFNLSFSGKLCSNKVRYRKPAHEVVRPGKPVGWIDIPIIHNHIGPTAYAAPAWYRTKLYRILSIILKLRDIARGW